MNQDKHTSAYWYSLPRYADNYVIYDPDGWDRSNYDYSFNKELITEEEFQHRLGQSTCMHSGGRP